MTGSRSWQGHDGGKVMTREASDRAGVPCSSLKARNINCPRRSTWRTTASPLLSVDSAARSAERLAIACWLISADHVACKQVQGTAEKSATRQGCDDRAPRGLPTAMTSCPVRSSSESPSDKNGSSCSTWIFNTAKSVSVSTPTTYAPTSLPLGLRMDRPLAAAPLGTASSISTRVALNTTCASVMM